MKNSRSISALLYVSHRTLSKDCRLCSAVVARSAYVPSRTVVNQRQYEFISYIHSSEQMLQISRCPAEPQPFGYHVVGKLKTQMCVSNWIFFT